MIRFIYIHSAKKSIDWSLSVVSCRKDDGRWKMRDVDNISLPNNALKYKERMWITRTRVIQRHEGVDILSVYMP